ncbi:MAG TPA: hypothetical protein VIW94_06375 [Acidimicrobiia bacterium]
MRRNHPTVIDGDFADLMSPRVGVLSAVIPLAVGWWAMGWFVEEAPSETVVLTLSQVASRNLCLQ